MSEDVKDMRTQPPCGLFQYLGRRAVYNSIAPFAGVILEVGYMAVYKHFETLFRILQPHSFQKRTIALKFIFIVIEIH
jgi:hypothetical protein